MRARPMPFRLGIVHSMMGRIVVALLAMQTALKAENFDDRRADHLPIHDDEDKSAPLPGHAHDVALRSSGSSTITEDAEARVKEDPNGASVDSDSEPSAGILTKAIDRELPIEAIGSSTPPDFLTRPAGLSYTMFAGADAFQFVIDATTGKLAVAATPDFETGSTGDTRDIAVSVSNSIDGGPIITSNGGKATAAVSVDENTVAVTAVRAAHADAGATFNYAIVGGADAFHFVIDPTTGALAFVTAPDFEAPADVGANNVYYVQVQVSDGAHVDTQEIAVTVTDVNDNAPVIASNGGGGAAVVSVNENTTAVTAVAAVDADAGTTLTYTIVGGADAFHFVIDATTGALAFVTAPDFEAPADAGANNVYDVQVQVSDGAHVDTQDIAVAVTNVAGSFVGTSGNDTFGGSSEEDVIVGLGGSDSLTGGAGADTIDGGAGNDTIAGSSGADTLTGGSGTDTLDYSSSGAAVTINLATNAAAGGDAAGDVISSFENIAGSTFDDALTGSSATNVINAGVGNDTITGGAGADNLTGGLGADVFVIGAVADLAAGETINGTAEAGTIDTLRLNAAGTYNLSSFTTITNIDAVALNANAAGFNLTLANSQVSTADANGDGTQDDLQISASLAMTNGVTINAAGLTGTNHLTVIGTNLGGADTITGGAGADSIDGGAGNDIIAGGAGSDTIDGGAGNDTITGGTGADNLTGGLGADVFVIGAVADLAAGETINGTAEAGTIDTLRLNAAGTYNLSGFTTITISLAVDASMSMSSTAVSLAPQALMLTSRESRRGIWRKINTINLFTKTPEVNSFGEFRPGENGFPPLLQFRSEQPRGYNPRKQREISPAQTSGERVMSEGWRRNGNWDPTLSGAKLLILHGWSWRYRGWAAVPPKPVTVASGCSAASCQERPSPLLLMTRPRTVRRTLVRLLPGVPRPFHLLPRGSHDVLRHEAVAALQLLERRRGAEGAHADDVAAEPGVAGPAEDRALLDRHAGDDVRRDDRSPCRPGPDARRAPTTAC